MALSVRPSAEDRGNLPIGPASRQTAPARDTAGDRPVGPSDYRQGDSRSSTPARLLIVEQDAALRQMLCWDLSDLGYRVTEACGFQAARQAIEQTDFDLILLEFTLSDGDAIVLARELSVRFPGLPIIMNSGLPGAALAAEGIQELFAFIPKPAATSSLHWLFQRALAGLRA